MLNEEEINLATLEILKSSALKIFNSTNFNKYLESCKVIEEKAIPKFEKMRQANTHYALYLIKIGLLLSASHQVRIFVENDELVIGDNRIKLYDMALLEDLCVDESISFIRNGNAIEIGPIIEHNLDQGTIKK